MTQPVSSGALNIKFEPCFSGAKDESARRWLMDFLYYKKITKLDDEKSRMLFSLKLVGMARDWMCSVPGYETLTMDQIEAKFRSTFIDSETKETIRMALYQRIYRPETETLLSYVLDVGTMADQLDGIIDSQKVDFVIRGLPISWRNLLEVTDKPKTVSEVLDKIRKFKLEDSSYSPGAYSCNVQKVSKLDTNDGLSASAACSSKGDVVTISMSELRDIIGSEVRKSLASIRTCSFCNRTNHVESRCWLKYGKPESTVRSFQSTTKPSENPVREMTSQERSKFKNYKCHSCNKMGHIRTFCRSRNAGDHLNSEQV